MNTLKNEFLGADIGWRSKFAHDLAVVEASL